MLKGQIHSVTHMILLLMVGAVLAGTIGGSLYGAMESGYNDIQQFLGMADRTELSKAGEMNATRDLVGITHYAWDRAHGCEQVQSTINAGGYDNLVDTSYTDEPPCSGQGGTIIASLSNLWGNTGDDMEGRVSRVKFEVKDRIILDTSKTYGVEGWEGNSKVKIDGEYQEPFRPWTVSTNKSPYNVLVSNGCRLPSEIGEASTSVANGWPVIFTEEVPEDKRIRRNGDAVDWQKAEDKYDEIGGLDINFDPFEFEASVGWDFGASDKPLCSQESLTDVTDFTKQTGFLAHDEMVKRWDGREGSTKIALCPGDEGYVQVNKGFAYQDGEFTSYSFGDSIASGIESKFDDLSEKTAGELVFGSKSDNYKVALEAWSDRKPRYFPYIQITSVNESSDCSLEPKKIPENANAKGSTLRISGDLDNEQGKYYDSFSSVDEFKLEKNRVPACRIRLKERDPDILGYNIFGPPEKGFIDYKSGAVLERSGSEGVFPGIVASSVSESEDFPGGVTGPKISDYNLEKEKNTWANVKRFFGWDVEGSGTFEMFEILGTEGLSGKNINPSDAPILDKTGGKSLKMYNDLLCVGNPEEADNPQWMACDESNFDGGEKIKVNPYNSPSETYKCNLDEGSWVKISGEGQEDDDGEDKPAQCETDADCSGDKICGDENICKSAPACNPVTNTGSTDEKIDVVFVGDGFQGRELENMVETVMNRNGESEGLFSKQPFDGNESLFNTWTVETDNRLPIEYVNPYRLNVTADGMEDFSRFINLRSESALSVEVTLTEGQSAVTGSSRINGIYDSDTLEPNAHEFTLEVNATEINDQGIRQELENAEISLERLSYSGLNTISETDMGEDGSIRVTGATDEGEFIGQLEEPAITEMQSKCQSQDVDEVVVLSDREQRSYADPENSPYSNTDDTKAVVFTGGQSRTPALFSHEFGHSFAGLRDEYVEPSLGDNPGQPNCADNQEQAQRWWGDIAEENDDVDYFNGCSYVNSNIRPMENTIMGDHRISQVFGPVNERRIGNVLDAYREGEIQ